ncbi:MerR family transcriptional regulator [Nocardia carnea]|uniref:MerR family transcriptional regulator n=1 Tax=Nocardia carnea TaxID=37328 RepID=UPI002458C978|nr:MerR family transcriptional regulator [Nocardia carnea]
MSRAADVVRTMRIGAAARAGGVSARSLRFYEDEGLIVPGRCGNGYRDYCRSTIDRVHVIRSLLESGLPVRLIREVIGRPDGGRAGSGPLGEGLLDEVAEYRDRLAARIATLDAQRAALETFLRNAGR